MLISVCQWSGVALMTISTPLWAIAWRKSVNFASALNFSALSPSRFLSTSQTATILPYLLALVASPVPMPPQPTSRIPGRSLGDFGSSTAACTAISSMNQRGSASDAASAPPERSRLRREKRKEDVVMASISSKWNDLAKSRYHVKTIVLRLDRGGERRAGSGVVPGIERKAETRLAARDGCRERLHRGVKTGVP